MMSDKFYECLGSFGLGTGCGYRFSAIEVLMAKFPEKMMCPRCKITPMSKAIFVMNLDEVLDD